MRKLESILLIDDDEATNFINKMIIQAASLEVKVDVCYNGREALDYLKNVSDNFKNNKPGIIFLDINMPYMNGWEFLEEYEKLEESCKALTVVAMLTTSLNPDDEERAKKYPSISKFLQKPLSKKELVNIIKAYFPETYAEQVIN